jgi:predicted AAA+ superfamily ATPase
MNEYEVINQAKVTKSALKSRLMHPISKKKFAPRHISAALEKYATDFFTTGNEPRMFCLAGLRGTGKTTLLWQVAEHIYQKHSKEIYFVNVNTLSNLGISLYQALEYFQTNIIKKRFNTLTKPIVFLFDEVPMVRES